MPETPNDIGAGGGGFNPWSLLLRPLNSLFGFGGQSGTPVDVVLDQARAGVGRGTGVFSSEAIAARRAGGGVVSTPPIPSANEPYRGPPNPSGAASVEPTRGSSRSSGKTKKGAKKKRTVLQMIRDQLAREAMYYAEHPTELLRVLPPGRGMGARMGRSGRPYRAAMERFPPSYQRGAVAAQGIGARPRPAARRARLDPRAGRIGSQRPRSAAKAPQVAEGTRYRPEGYLRPAQVVKGLPTEAYDSETPRKPAKVLKASQVVPNLPFEDYDAEGEPNAPRRASSPGRTSAPGRGESRPGAGRTSPVRVPAPASGPAAMARSALANLPSTVVEGVLRAVTRRVPRVRALGSAATRAVSLPIGDFPASGTAPVGAAAPILGFAQGVKPFPVPQEALDKCRCDRKKKRETKKRQPRTICRAGSYIQTAKGVKYHPNREVPCT